MTKNVAVVYHTQEGHSAEVAERIADRVRQAGCTADLFAVDQAPGSLARYDGVVAGGSIHMGRHHKLLETYLRSHTAELNAKPSAFFSVSLTASDPDPHAREAVATIVHDLLDRAGWQPDMVALVGGALAYTKYGFIKRHLMKRIAKREGGETDTSRDWDRTDWPAVDAFADDFATHVIGISEAVG